MERGQWEGGSGNGAVITGVVGRKEVPQSIVIVFKFFLRY